MDEREIQVLLTLADELHFRRTAEALHISTAAVSQTIARLERRVGVKLFTRTSRQVQLTAVGRRLVEDVTPARAQIQAAVAAATEAGRRLESRLRVGYMSAAVGRQLLTLVDSFQFARARPRSEVTIIETSLIDMFGPLRRGEVDLSILPLPVCEDDLVVGKLFFREPAAVAVPVRNRLAQRGQLTAADISGELVLDVDGTPDYWRGARGLGSSSPATRPTVTGFQELLTLVEAGRGVAVVGAQCADFYPRPGLAFVPLVDVAPFEYAPVRRRGDTSDVGRAFLQHIGRRPRR